MTVTVEFIHLHAYHLSERQKKASATMNLFQNSLEVKVWALRHQRKLVLQNETPGNSLFNMYISHYLIPTCTWLGWDWMNGANNSVIIVEPSRSSRPAWPNLPLLSSPDHTAALFLYIQYSLFFNSVKPSLQAVQQIMFKRLKKKLKEQLIYFSETKRRNL